MSVVLEQTYAVTEVFFYLCFLKSMECQKLEHTGNGWLSSNKQIYFR
jgi:hypothetical protein